MLFIVQTLLTGIMKYPLSAIACFKPMFSKESPGDRIALLNMNTRNEAEPQHFLRHLLQEEAAQSLLPEGFLGLQHSH